MTKTKKLLKLNIQLFADGGAAGDGSAAGEGVTATDAMSQEGVTDQVANDQEGTTETVELTPEQLEAEYEEAIKGKYKDIHQKKMSKVVSLRVNELKPKVDKYNRSQSLIQKLADRYGIKDAEDIDSIESAFDNDDPKLEEEALEMGLTVDQLKEIKQLRRENQQWKKEKADEVKRKQEEARQQAINQQLEKWNQEAQGVKGVYSNFDIDTEIKNKDFSDLIAAGIPMQKAYEVVHFQELMTSGMQTAQKEAEKKIANAVASNTKRVAENGVSGNAAAVVHTDVSKMTREQIEDINARVLRGERVVLG